MFLAFALSVSLLAAPIPQQAAAADNAEMKALFDADQAVRAGLKPEQVADRAFVLKMIADDRQRRATVRELLDRGALQTGEDFYAAAFVFQHGSTAEDYLLAHSLAMAAMAKGKAEANWIAAATLDRYLQKVGQKQIYGTQYITSKEAGPTMEPYDRALVPDRLRAALAVPEQPAQDARLSAMKAALPPAK